MAWCGPTVADGKAHAGIAGLNVAISVPLALYLRPEYGDPVAAGVVVGAMAGYVMTPDLDLPTKTHEERRMIRRFGFLGRLWLAYWSPYSWILSHRGLSHWPVIGTATRAVYAFWWLGWFGYLELIDPAFLWAAFWAWCAQDLYHLAADSFGLRLSL